MLELLSARQTLSLSPYHLDVAGKQEWPSRQHAEFGDMTEPMEEALT